MNNIIGRIHSEETLGTVDGPGIRYVIFMQGCPLKCKYCHNRDTWEINAGKEVSIEELINRIYRSKTYIKASGGGVTVSGGEPLLQAQFVTELFKVLKAKQIHTCLDTSGSIPLNSDIKELLKYTDLVLLDIKQINDEKCKNLCDISNRNNIEFANYLNSINKPVWIRQVLVPGYTDSKDDLTELKKLIDSFDNVQKVEILPYHNLGKYKWENLGLEYPLEGVIPPTEEQISEAKKILNIKY